MARPTPSHAGQPRAKHRRNQDAATESAGAATGTLYIVGTPIGNLGDISSRALETLRLVEHIAAEDTRHTRTLLAFFGIAGKSLSSIEAHRSPAELERVSVHLREGRSVALVTDAGMPAISDPGARVVAAAREAGFKVEVIPGPSALTAAIALSGLVEGPFLFLGFLPRQGGRRTRALERIARTEEAVVLFEAPQRASDTLRALASIVPDRRLALCRELTKLHEEVLHGTAAQIADSALQWRGEIVLVLSAVELEAVEALWEPELYRQSLAEGESPRTLVERSGLIGQRRRELYDRLLVLRDELAADGSDEPEPDAESEPAEDPTD